jgi:excisionase family DNA binding protein
MRRLRPQPPTQIEPRLRAAEAAALLGVSPRLVQALCARGELKAVRIGRLWTITETALTQYLTTCAAPADAPRHIPAPLAADAPQRPSERPLAPRTASRAVSPTSTLPAAPTRSRFESLLQRRS